MGGTSLINFQSSDPIFSGPDNFPGLEIWDFSALIAHTINGDFSHTFLGVPVVFRYFSGYLGNSGNF